MRSVSLLRPVLVLALATVPAALPATVPATVPAGAAAAARVHLTVDASEAEQVLALLDLRAAGRPLPEAAWERLFATAPYRRLKLRQQQIAQQSNDPRRVLTDDAFRAFVLSDALLGRAAALRATLRRWQADDLQRAGERALRYLPRDVVIRATVFPVIKPEGNSFVWEPSTDPAIFLALDPAVSAAKLGNTVAHELHHVGLAAASAAYERRIELLPTPARTVAEWLGAFGEGLAMLAAAGGPDVDPHATSSAADRTRWRADMAHVDADLETVDAFFRDVLEGRLRGPDAIAARASSFFGVQGPWYTVGYRMAVLVEQRFGHDAVLEAVLDPRRLLELYNRAAAERNAQGHLHLPLWSDEVLERVAARPASS